MEGNWTLVGSVRICVQRRLSAGGGHGKRLVVETNPAMEARSHDRHVED